MNNKPGIKERISDGTYAAIGVIAIVLVIAIIVLLFVTSAKPEKSDGTETGSTSVSQMSNDGSSSDSSSSDSSSSDISDSDSSSSDSSSSDSDSSDSDSDSSSSDSSDSSSSDSDSSDSDSDSSSSDSSDSSSSDSDDASKSDEELALDAANAYCAERVEKHDTISDITYNDKFTEKDGVYLFEFTVKYSNDAGDKKAEVTVEKDENGKYIQFNASKGVILATGDYMNNDAMVKRWCPDIDGYDKKQYQKTGDGYIMAIDAGAKMENLGHTKMMHDFDSGLMYEEPFLYVNMEGKRFCNEDTGFVYMGNITKYLPKFNGDNVDANHPDGSLGWYCQIYDSDYMNYANSPVPEQVMTKYIPGAVENPQGVFSNLIDTYTADTIEELAGLLGIPADELQKTIDRYNELCDKGSDVDFGKKSTYMHKIEKAPFWGIQRSGTGR